jgi:hypothetical protein
LFTNHSCCFYRTYKDDAFQYNCALSLNKIDFIVTRDTKDFKKSVLAVMNPEEALSLIIESASRKKGYLQKLG